MTYKLLKIKSRGFTLIETLVAVLLLSTAIAGPLTIASKGLTSALVAKDQITAYFLAQDAIEYVRYARDSTCLATAPSPCSATTWLSALSACVSSGGTAKCYLDSTNNTPAAPLACPGSGCVKIRYDSSLHRFTYAATSGNVKDTIYTRSVSITNPYGTSASCTPAGKCEALVVVTVTWSDIAGITHTLTTQENIFNWQ